MILPGAHPDARGTTFVVWSTTARSVAVRLFDEQVSALRTEPLEALGEGRFAAHVEGVKEGALYKFVLEIDGTREETPDPYARFLPFGIHGPARVVAPTRTEPLCEPLPQSRLVIYELHVGTFTPEGTFRGAEQRLEAIAELGFTAIELLPVAAFAGERGWGYDGVALYAPYAPCGEPEDLRSLVRAAHDHGLAVVMDVVYNHFGPAGNHLWKCAPEYFTTAALTPWGPAPDFAHASMRPLVLDNARAKRARCREGPRGRRRLGGRRSRRSPIRARVNAFQIRRPQATFEKSKLRSDRCGDMDGLRGDGARRRARGGTAQRRRFAAPRRDVR